MEPTRRPSPSTPARRAPGVRMARAYLRAESGYQVVQRGMRGAWTGAWLGLLDRDTLHAVDAAYYDGVKQYTSDEHNLRGLVDWEIRALEGYFPPSGRLLLIGAGGGRDLVGLAQRGYQVDGYECNATLLASAEKVIAPYPGSRALPIERDRAPTDGGPWDGAIVGWGAYMLIAGRDRRIALLRGIRPRLTTGAPLLLSFYTRPGDTTRYRMTHRVASALRAIRRAEPVEIGDDLAPNFVHRFVEAEVRAEMEEAGFGLERYTPQGTGRFDSGWAVGRAR